MWLSVSFAILGLALIYGGWTTAARPQVKTALAGFMAAYGWQLSQSDGGLTLSGNPTSRPQWILRTGDGTDAATYLVVGQAPVPNRVTVVRPCSARQAETSDGVLHIPHGDGPSLALLPRGEVGSLYSFEIVPTHAPRFQDRCSRDLELALRGFYRRLPAGTRPILEIYAGRNGVAVKTDRPVIDPSAVEALVFVGLEAAECLTGWCPEAKGDENAAT
jgi:hypothetical protein